MSYLSRRIEPTAALPAAGFLATAIAYGPARMAYGLFLPDLRATFGLSTELAGLIASAAFGAFLAGLPLGAALLTFRGPRAPVLVGGATATAGLGLAAVAETTAMLASGVVLAASSAGFCWTPYNNAAERIAPREKRAHTLSVISTGTTVGVAIAGGLALAAAFSGLGWRVAWVVFAGGALLMTLANIPALRPVAGDPGTQPGAGAGVRSLKRAETRPLAVAAVSFGITSALYLSFAVDRATTAGALAVGPLDSAAPLLFVAFGIAGLVGLATGEIENRVGLPALVWSLFAASALSFALMALRPGAGWAVLLSAALQGAVIMMMSAVFSFWSARLFPQIPSVSFTAVLVLVAIGSVIGPAIGGVAADAGTGGFGLEGVFYAGAALSALTPLGLSATLIEQASSRPWRPGRRSRTIFSAPA
ncbi:MAG: MFS transporter [Marivibrio sp.]|uniref:MFS transporter n=1 Tax=Marivibrio sp. TaxID=2039719 RepID=UPI0032EC6A5E